MIQEKTSSTAVEKVEEFIRRRDAFEIVIDDEKARDILFGVGKLKSITLADALGRVLGKYMAVRENAMNHPLPNPFNRSESNEYWNEMIKQPAAVEALIWIEKAYGHGAIKEGDGLLGKLKAMEEKIKTQEKLYLEAMQRTNETESESKKTEERYAALDKMFNNLAEKVKKDFGQRYLEDAIATDPTVIESDVTDANEDSKNV